MADLKIKLKTPIAVGTSVVVEELIFHKPKAKYLRGLSLTIGEGGAMKLEFDSILKLAARCCGQTDYVIGELDVEDMAEVGQAIMGFIENFQTTGQTA